MNFRTLNLSSRLRRLALGAVVINLLALALCLSAGVASARGVRDELQTARALFERGRLKSAAKLLLSIARRYPDNAASYHLLGRIYYRTGDLRTAARYFKKSGGDYLDGVSGFEYGISFFSIKDCGRALRGFQKTNAPTLSDLANFYAGVCEFRNRDYLAAERSLRRAQKLPENFMASRRQLLLEIQKRRRFEATMPFAQPAPYVPLPVPQQQPFYYQQPGFQPYAQQPQQPGLPPGPGAPNPENLADESSEADKKPVKVEPPKIETGLGFDTTTKVEYVSDTTETSLHSTTNSTAVKRGPRAAVDLLAHYRLSPDKTGRQTEYNLALSTTFQSLDNSKTDTTYVIDDTASAEALQTSKETRSTDRSATYELKPYALLPMATSMELEGGLKYGETLPDFKQDKKSSYVGPYAAFSFGIGEVNSKVSAEFAIREQLNADSELVKTTDQKGVLAVDIGGLPLELVGNVNIDVTMTTDPTYGSLDGFNDKENFALGLKKNWDSFSLGVTATKSLATQPKEPVSGATDVTKAVLTATKSLKIGLSITAFGEYSLIDQYTQTGLCPADASGAVTSCGETTQTATASGDRYGYGGTIKFAPLEWAYASVTYEVRESSYVAAPAELQADFRAHVVDYKSTLSILAGLTYGF